MDSYTQIGIPTVSHDGRAFGISQVDRRQHIYAIGKSGYGKSTLLRNIAIQDIQAGRGLCFVDPHGGEAEALVDYIPPSRADDFVYIDAADLEHAVAFNVLEKTPADERPLVAAHVVSIFRSLWRGSWGPRMEHILYNTIAALLDYPHGATLLGVPRMFYDERYRRRIVGSIRDPKVRSFWIDEFSNYNDRFRVEATSPIENKVGRLLAPPVIRNIVGQVKSTIHPRILMDNRKIVIARLPVGILGEDATDLLASLFVTKFQLGALARAAESGGDYPDFALIVDEFQRVTTDSFVSILSEARKGKLCLLLAHQYMEQVAPEILSAVIGNAGTLISFRVGGRDAKELAPEFAPRSTASLQELDVGEICIRLLDRGELLDPFTARTLQTYAKRCECREKLIVNSRRHYTRQREVVQRRIERSIGG